MELPFNQSWWELSDPTEAARAVVALEEQYAKDYMWRRARARRLTGMYHGRNLDTPFAQDARFSWRDVRAGTPDYIPLVRNKAFMYVETAVSKIGANDKPQPALMVTDGDWALKRKVTLNSRLLEAEYGMRQGPQYPNVHALTTHGLRIALGATGTVAAKIYPWPEENRVVVELHDTLDMFLDDTELSYGYPRTYGEVTWWPPARLQHAYPKHAEEIARSVESRRDRGGLTYTGRSKRAELVPVWEAWAVKIGDTDGRHIVALRSGTVLLDEPWESDEPPFAFLHTSPTLAGLWSTPLMEQVYDEILKVNEILFRCDEAHMDNAQQVHYVDEKQLVDINDITGVDTIKVVRVKGNYRPQVENPAPFNRIDLDLLHEHERGIAETLGIDQMHTAAKGEPGLPSAVAQREVAGRFDDRFASLHRAYVQWVAVDIARHMLKAQRKLFEDNRAFKRKWTGELFSKEIEAKDILDLDLESLQVQVKPISERKNTPEERVQYAEELLEKGAIPFEAYMACVENYDVPGETRVIKTQRRWVAVQIDKWLMASDAETNDPDFYNGPRPWLRLADALVQVVDALMEAEVNEVPVERLQYFLDFIAELSELMSAQVNPPQAPQAPLGMSQPMQGSAGMNAGASGLMAPGLNPGALPQPGPAMPPGVAGAAPPAIMGR